MSVSLNLISFDIPFPPNYGGVIDVFYKIRCLAEAGAQIHLHCFRFRKKPSAPELRKFCKEVLYYDRPLHPRYLFNERPFVVATRRVPTLLKNLKANPYPVFFEGVHCCGFLDAPALKNRRKLVRMHNIEWKYYRHLAHLERNLLKKGYLYRESQKLKAFESRIIEHADLLLPISSGDESYFREREAETRLLPAFHGDVSVTGRTGKGAFVLFHGNLKVRDNERAALFLIEKVFRHIPFPVVIAGLSPSRRLRNDCARQAHIYLSDSPGEKEMTDLMREAHIHLLYSHQSDGIKIKLLRALSRGRHVIANRRMVAGSGLESLCHIANTGEEIQRIIRLLIDEPFEKLEKLRRREVLSRLYSDARGAKIILDALSN